MWGTGMRRYECLRRRSSLHQIKTSMSLPTELGLQYFEALDLFITKFDNKGGK